MDPRLARVISALFILLLGLILAVSLTKRSLLYSEDPGVNYKRLIENIFKREKSLPIDQFPQLLHKPLCEFAINTSHNTYISGNQHLSVVRPNHIRDVLRMGARAVELDISKAAGHYIVAHGNGTMVSTFPSTLQSALKVVYEFALTTTDPILLLLEVNVLDIASGKEISATIKSILEPKFLPASFKVSNSSDQLPVDRTPIKDLLGKIIIISTMGNDGLETIVDKNYMINRDTTAQVATYPNQLGRVYPYPTIATVLSMNYDPSDYWSHKYNMTALNFQTYDKHLYTNTQQFATCSFIPFSIE